MQPRPRGRTDNVALNLFDYMASGKPIIATRQAAYEPVLDETRAFICDPTPKALASALTRTCRSPREAQSVGRVSRDTTRAANSLGRDSLILSATLTPSRGLAADSESPSCQN